MQGTSSGDIQRLVDALAEDVVFVEDGGGKVPGAGLQPVHSRDNVARGLMANLTRFRAERLWLEEVNGGPAIVATRAG